MCCTSDGTMPYTSHGSAAASSQSSLPGCAAGAAGGAGFGAGPAGASAAPGDRPAGLGPAAWRDGELLLLLPARAVASVLLSAAPAEVSARLWRALGLGVYRPEQLAGLCRYLQAMRSTMSPLVVHAHTHTRTLSVPNCCLSLTAEVHDRSRRWSPCH